MGVDEEIIVVDDIHIEELERARKAVVLRYSGHREVTLSGLSEANAKTPLFISSFRVRIAVKRLRRLYASLRFALGDDPVYVAAQLGHTEPGFSMKVYACAVHRRERLVGAALREFDAALEWAAMGSGEPASAESEPVATDKQSPETAQQSLFTA